MTRRGKSERIAKNKSFSIFTNDRSKPIEIEIHDEPNLVVNTTPVQARESHQTESNMQRGTTVSEEFTPPPGKRTKSMARRGDFVKVNSAVQPVLSKSLKELEQGSSNKQVGGPSSQQGKDMEPGSSNVQRGGVRIQGSLKLCKKANTRQAKEVVDDGKQIKAKRKTKLKQDVCKTGGGSKMKKPQTWLGLRTRSSPHRLFETIGQLSARQRTWVKSMGFSRFLGFKVDEIPTKLARYVIDVFDTESMKIAAGKTTIDVTQDSIYRLVGLPNEGLNINELPDLKNNAPTYNKWRYRYGGGYISAPSVMTNIREDKYTESLMFKLDFLVLFHTSMIESYKNGMCKHSFLENFDFEIELNEYNWCKYIWDVCKGCKKDWKPNSPTDYFVGPLTILTLLYVDCTYCPGVNDDRTESPLRFWSKSNLSLRANIELIKGGFGNCMLRDQYADTHDYENEDVDPPKHDEDGGVAGLFDVCDKEDVQGQVKVLDRILDYVYNEKKKVKRFLDDTVQVFGDNEDVSTLVSMIRSLYDNGLDEPADGKDEEPMTWTQTVADVAEAFEYFHNVLPDASIQADTDFAVGDLVTSTKASASGTLKTTNTYHRREKRAKHPSTTICSPFIDRIVQIDKPLTPLERKVCEYLVSCLTAARDQYVEAEKNRETTSSSNCASATAKGKGKKQIDASEKNLMDAIYQTSNGFKVTTMEMIALAKGDEVTSKVIDMWSVVLNHEERLRSSTSPHRLFANTLTFPSKYIISAKPDAEDMMLAEFAESLQFLLSDRSDVPSLKSFDIVIFPFVETGQFSLYAFDLRRVSVMYLSPLVTKITPEKVHDCMVKYLRYSKHPKWGLMEKVVPEPLSCPPLVASRPEDRLLILMRAMEWFMGLDSNILHLGLPDDKRPLKAVVMRIRKKYAARVLLSETNTVRDDVLTESNECGNKKRKS